jgi:hypothetical protein
MDDRTLFIMLPLLGTILALAIWGFVSRQPDSRMTALIGVPLALYFIGMIVIFGLYLAEEKDEFERSVFSQSMLWAVGATMIVTSTWGVLELFEKVRHLNPVYFVPLYCSFMSAARILIKRRYR